MKYKIVLKDSTLTNWISKSQFDRIYACIEDPSLEHLYSGLLCYCGAIIYAYKLHEQEKEVYFQLMEGRYENLISHGRVYCEGKVYETNTKGYNYSKVLKSYKISPKENIKQKLIKIFKDLEKENYK